jgi:hypothetical protein
MAFSISNPPAPMPDPTVVFQRMMDVLGPTDVCIFYSGCRIRGLGNAGSSLLALFKHKSL